MPSFDSLFQEARGSGVSYSGRLLFRVDRFPVENARVLRIVIESTKSNWKQGMMLNFHGHVLISGKSYGEPIVFWQDTAPPEIQVKLDGSQDTILFRNVWDVGNGVTHSWHNGAAMWIEEIESGKRYHCNDGFPDDDFDDIVFRVERME